MTAVLPSGVAWLFCPADRPDRYAKAAAGADVVVLDLEDGVATAAKAAARAALLDAAATLDWERTVVRVNPAGTEAHAADVELLRRLPPATVMLPKAESQVQVASVDSGAVVALCETARGILAADAIAGAPNCAGLMWGAEDLVADLGGSSSRRADGGYRDVALHARSQVLLAAGANGVAALDAVYLDIADLDGLGVEAADAAASGFAAKVCIHPTQVPAVRSAFAPAPDALAWARRVLAAVAAPGAHGVVAVDGRMVDEPLLRQARHLLAAAGGGSQ